MTLALYLLVTIFSVFAQQVEEEQLKPAPVTHFSEGKYYGNEKEEGMAYFRKFIVEDKLSFEYFRGEYLVYDCYSKHFACVNQKSYQSCQDRLNFALVQREDNKVCIPIKKLTSQRECFETHYMAQEKSRMSLFCKN